MHRTGSAPSGNCSRMGHIYVGERARRATGGSRLGNAAFDSISAITHQLLAHPPMTHIGVPTSVVWGRKLVSGMHGKFRASHPVGPSGVSSSQKIFLSDGQKKETFWSFSELGRGEPPHEGISNRRFHEQQRHNARDASRHFYEMVRMLPTGSVPRTESLNALLRVYTNARWVRPAEGCLAKFRDLGVPYDMATRFALIEMYCCVRQVDSALNLVRRADLPELSVDGKGTILLARALRLIENALLYEKRGGECLHLLRASKLLELRR